MDLERPQVRHAGETGAGRAGTVSWRLVGANNHELGRGPELHRDHTACSAAVGRLRAGLDRAVPHVLMASADGAWTWELAVDDRRVAVASRAFRRQRECRDSLRLFLAAAAEGQVAADVTHTRRLRDLRLPDAVQGNAS
ncbi:hypothetical protein [Streptomyces sp. NPDC056361]|uniref:hypothetical protein n=1 Tax=Streptomyces sp. NPDC056361 TaxID=3345795 RepID=UPI0035E2BC81